MISRILPLFISVFFWIACTERPIEEVDSHLTGRHLDSLSAAVACAHPAAASIGAEVLRAGGNAIDAAVAVQWALAVCYPQAGNIGGGGFMVYRSKDGQVSTLDFREKAPAAAYEKMFQDNAGEVVAGISLNTRLAAGVPGSVEGIYAMHRDYGSMDMDRLIQPAIDMATNGFELTDRQANLLNSYRDEFLSRNLGEVAFVKPQGEWQAGDLLLQPDLAATLERIREHGEAEFYAGTTASMIVDEMIAGRGLISAQDLAEYTAERREPIETRFGPYRVYGMPPPSSGGIAIGQMLAMAHKLQVDTAHLNTAEYLHLLTEIERRVYADRSRYLGDPDFFRVPVRELLDSAYLASRIADIDPFRPTPSAEVNPGILAPVSESTETTHLSVVDSEGNAVSITTTLNGLFGTKIVVTGAGFLLNNEMDDFSAKPGSPNMFGLIGGSANAIAPHKRMLSSMSPTIVTRDNDLLLVAGSPGGSTIITTVFQTIMNTAVYGLNLQQSLETPRFHSQWWPDQISVEQDRFDPLVLRELENRGHVIKPVESLGRVDAVLVNPDGTLQASGDPRGDDRAAGIRNPKSK